jgi:hypothetical protein
VCAHEVMMLLGGVWMKQLWVSICWIGYMEIYYTVLVSFLLLYQILETNESVERKGLFGLTILEISGCY